MTLVLASRSPQRRAILEQLGIRFEVRPADVRERSSGAPEEVVGENAIAKASAVAAECEPSVAVLGVDTIVVLDGALYGKARDADEARRYLDRLSGCTHEVWSGLAFVAGETRRVGTCRTLVTFRRLDAAMLEWYLDSGEWRERAGGYAIQHRGAALVERIEGDYSNVVGLPVALLVDLARDLPALSFSLHGASDLPKR